MVLLVRLLVECRSLVNFPVIFRKSFHRLSASKLEALNPQNAFSFRRNSGSEIDFFVEKTVGLKDEMEVFRSLVQSLGSETVQINDTLFANLLHRFQDDWKSALGVFRWIESCSCYRPKPELYDKLLDILGKAKQMEKMKILLDEMREDHIVSLDTVAKAMRRFAGARAWQGAVKLFDELENFGLRKNTESMNILLDTLCKEWKVEKARSIFLQLKSHIPPNANTYNILIHGWCKVKRVEEAQWTIQEMKGYGFRPCVVSYSTIIRFYCDRSNFDMVYEVLEEMKTEGCRPNVVTFTTILHSLTKVGKLKEALQVPEKMRLMNCKPDTQFYNALIHTLGRAGNVNDALHVFENEMPRNGVRPNTSTYNTMISMFCHHREEEKALEYLGYLENSPDCKPDLQSFHPLLKSCFRDGKTDEILSRLLDDMVKKQHLGLDLGSFTLLIHGYCRTKECELAYELFREMVGRKLQPRYNTCSLLLQAIGKTKRYDAAEVIEDFMKKMKSL